MMREKLIFYAVILAGAAMILMGACTRDPSEQRPNVILCMTDDQGWGDTGYNGHPVLRTPNLDQMAMDGLRFDRFYSGAPVCSPTRGSCITGRHPYRYGIHFANDGQMKKEEITLAEVLKNEGYLTGHFGKWHLGTLTTKIKDSNRGNPGDSTFYSPPWKNGFDECFSTEAKVPTYWKKGDYTSYGTYYWTGPEQMVPGNEVDGDDSRLIMDRALSFIEKASKTQSPFLAVIWFHTPHLPVVSAPPYTDGYSEHMDYYGCITAMDQQMGRLRTELKNLGVADNTMLWFCSDNGPEGDDSAAGRTKGLRGRKRSLYEGGIRVPGLLVWPRVIKEKQIVTMPCSTSDYFPTILDVLEYRLQEDQVRPYDGISLLPFIREKKSERPKPIAFESKDQISLIDNRYKIYSDNRGESYQLYDLVADQGESTDIADQHPDIVEGMTTTLETWRQSCKGSSMGNDY